MADAWVSTVSIGDQFYNLAAAAPDFPAVTCAGVTLSRAEANAASNRLARAYANLGVKQGDFVTIGLPNGIEFVLACQAVWKLGAIPQPVSWRLPKLERDAIIELAEPALVVGVDPAEHPDRQCLAPGFEPDPALDDSPLPTVISPSFKAPTSGGSTGRPKLIVSGSPGAVAAEGLGAVFGMLPDECHLLAGPLYHNGPFTYGAIGMLLGHHLVILEKFDAEVALRAIEEFGVQWLMVVPTMMQRMLRAIQAAPDACDLSSIRQVWHMAAPCPAWLKDEWIDLIGPEKVWELYGGTESQAFTVVDGNEWRARPGTVGKSVFGTMVILDPDGKQLPAGEVGEIFMRRPDGSPETYHYVGAEVREVDGWESIGDLGWMDDDDYVYISDRRTDLILAGGANIYPAEVEAALLECPGVVSCAVVGLPDDDLGERVHAVVQTDGTTDETALRRELDTRLVRYKIPRSFDFVDEPLRDDAGKVRRSAIRDAAIARTRAS